MIDKFLEQAFPQVDADLVRAMAQLLQQRPEPSADARAEIEHLKEQLEAVENEALRLNQRLLSHMVGTKNATKGGLDVLAERASHYSDKGFTDSHDDNYSNYEMISAAMAHLSDARLRAQGIPGHKSAPPDWALDETSWKAKDTIRDSLVVGASFIIAEIDRIDRSGLDKI
jgi:exonuclease VII large subunit